MTQPDLDPPDARIPEGSIRYHWLLTIAGKNERALAGRTWDGVIHAAPGVTRREVYWRIMNAICGRAGIPADQAIVLFFELHPDQLAGD